MPTEAEVLRALGTVEDPELGRDVVSLNMVRDLEVRGDRVRFALALTTAACPLRDQLVEAARQAVARLRGVKQVEVAVTEMTPAERERTFRRLREERPHPDNHVRHSVAVMSGKGGVGKSSVTTLLAVALRRRGYTVGILDADITGPSIPRMLFPSPPRPEVVEEGFLPPETQTGIKVMSINLLLPSDDQAVIWRGPLISGAIRQFWEEVVWGDLDYLLVDLPPGTSDASLTVLQTIPLNGILLVTSPQALSAMVVRKAASMARQLRVPIVGVIENLAYVDCRRCAERIELFGPSHSAELAADLGTELLGRLPVDPELAALTDSGRAECHPAEAFAPIVERFLPAAPGAGEADGSRDDTAQR
ncbi:MAG: Mrp/NBP35 family ATP-binding protein [Anaerolineae bacterium]